MNTLLTVFAQIMCLSVGVLAAWSAVRSHERAQREADSAHYHHQKLKEERARVTVCEREIEALRRELRKLSGKFHASLQELAVPDEQPPTYVSLRESTYDGLTCTNWALAQHQGPLSDAAKCECDYCAHMRAQREAFRSATVPKTVRGQAEIAKLNAGKP